MAKLDASSVKINEEDIPRELINQPEFFFEAATLLAKARRVVAEKKSELEVVAAEVSFHIRANPATYGLTKITEGSVNEALVQSVKHKQATADYTKARYDQDHYQALVDALEHKKKSLESLTYLLGQNFFSAPKAGSSDPELKKMGDRAKARKKAE